MRLFKIFLTKTISSEFSDELAFGRILQNKLGAITIRHIDIAIRTNAGFSRFEFVAVSICPNEFGMFQGQQDLAVQGCLVDFAQLMVGDIQKLLTALIVYGQTMPPGELVTPTVQ